MRSNAITALLPALLLLAGTAGAMDKMDKVDKVDKMDKADAKAMSFDQLDKDGNGRISMLEAAGLPALKTNFKAADKDNDLSLSRQEFDDLHAKDVSTGATGGRAASGTSTNAERRTHPGK